MSPPHLPPKTDNSETHRFLQRFKWLLFIVVIAVLAGASGASMMLGWIWPRFAEGDVWINSYNRPGLSRAQLENLIRDEISSRLVGVHRGSTGVGGVNFFNKKLGDGIMLSSDGWLVVYQPKYDGIYKNIYIVGSGDQIYQAENAVWDKFSGMLYLKIKNDQFKVVEFIDDPEYSGLDDIFVWQNNNWYHGSVLYPVLNYKIPHTDIAPVRQYSLNGVFESGGVAINSQGRVVGLISENNLLMPVSSVTHILGKVLSKQILSYPSLGVDGWFSEEQTIFVDSKNEAGGKAKAQGFFVSAVWGSGSLLRKGDLITEVNGRIVNVDNLWYIINNVEMVKVKVLRNGKASELDIKILQTK